MSNSTIVMETKFEGVPVSIICINEGPHTGKYRAVIQAFSILTSVQDTIGGAIDRAVANIQSQLNAIH